MEENKLNNNKYSYNPKFSDLKKTKERANLNKENFIYENSTGEKFVEILENTKARQIFVSRILKGVLPVADVFENNKKVFSKKMNLDESPEYSERERESAFFILREVFYD